MNSRLAFGIRRRAFTDTSGYFAFLDATEHNHVAAVHIATRLGTERWQVFTTNFIMAEAHALILIRLGHRAATRFLDELESSGTAIVRVSASDERRAREIIRQYDDKLFSYVDATSFSVMERLRISYAFSFDHNFSQFGFTLLVQR